MLCLIILSSIALCTDSGCDQNNLVDINTNINTILQYTQTKSHSFKCPIVMCKKSTLIYEYIIDKDTFYLFARLGSKAITVLLTPLSQIHIIQFYAVTAQNGRRGGGLMAILKSTLDIELVNENNILKAPSNCNS